MATWRELGEVPDSEEDDSFDEIEYDLPLDLSSDALTHKSKSDAHFVHRDSSRDPLPAPEAAKPRVAAVPTAAQKTAPNPLPPADDQVWDFITTSTEDAPSRFQTESTRVTGTYVAKTIPAADDAIWDIRSSPPGESWAQSSTPKLRIEVPTGFPVGYELEAPEWSPLTEAADEPVYNTADTPASRDPITPTNSRAPETKLLTTPQQHHPRDESDPDTNTTVTARAVNRDEEGRSMTVETAGSSPDQELGEMQHRRAFRPRKPIQEHPYVVEQARYSYFCKSRGIKPVRIAPPSETPQKRQDEDSQGQEYDEEEESQNTNLPDTIGLTQQSNTNDRQAVDGDVVPLSSPPMITPRNLAGVQSSLVPADADDTERTSVVGDEDDLPSLNELVSRPQRIAGKNLKRPRAPHVSLSPKRQKIQPAEKLVVTSDVQTPRASDVWNLSSSPIRAPVPRRRRPPRTPASAASAQNRIGLPILIDSDPEMPDVADQDMTLDHDYGHDGRDKESDRQSDRQSESASESESESETAETEFDVAQAAGKRIKGVLPASWLRLDQQAFQQKAQAAPKRPAPDRSPERVRRRGVAQPRVGAPASSSRPLQWLEDLDRSDEEDENQPPQTASVDSTFGEEFKRLVQSVLVLEEVDDDSGSAMEDNYIDPMLSRKRPLPTPSSRPRPKKQKTSSGAGKSTLLYQPKITSFGVSNSGSKPTKVSSARAGTLKPGSRRSTTKAKGRRSTERARKVAPRLSILDVIQPDAPSFLKIAARTAMRRGDKGRCSPTSKLLHLADRCDTLDLMTVMESWRRGTILPRESVVEKPRSRPSKARPSKTRPLQPVDETIWDRRPTQLRIQRTSAADHQPLANAQLDIQRKTPHKRKEHHVGMPRAGGAQIQLARPALLETELADQPDRIKFHQRKKMLDRLYRKSGARPALARFVGDMGGNGMSLSETITQQSSRSPSPDAPRQSTLARQKPRRRKKPTVPVHVDVEAPRFVPSYEPIVFSPLLAADVVDVDDIQELLRQAFDTYRREAQLPPGFNEYCRALVGRCHFLIQQWEPRKASSIVGTIFDFFASQNLSHLQGENANGSPGFLNNLHSNPQLHIEPQDRCFHIFLKMVASLVKRLAQKGATGPINNLIARTMPNHDRSYHRDRAIERRDLASLQNHHDLLCTLFWATPPKMRRSLRMIENLVTPANSHKEACLINLRAWTQLARLMISEECGPAALQPLGAWQVSIFKQVLNQYDSVAADVQQQFLALAKDVSHAADDGMIRAMVASNKMVLLDVLHESATASLDVIQHARSLRTGQFAVNIWQLQQIFQRFTKSPPEFEWRVLQPALATLDRFLDMINEHAPEHLGGIGQVEDAIMDLHHGVASPFFSMARTLGSIKDERLRAEEAMARDVCVQQCLSLAARLTLRFSQAGVLNLSQVFVRGRYSVFSARPSELSLVERKYLPFFVSVLLERGQSYVGDLGVSLLELWLVSIVKPRPYLLCENVLGEHLRRQMMCGFVPEAHSGMWYVTSDYNANRRLFEFSVSYMRHTLRDTDAAKGRRLGAEYADALRAVMRVLKDGLKAMASDAKRHGPYVGFVRSIITLIRTHASEMCGIDEFFLQISPEYTPSSHDPRLRIAGMISYGLRLEEGDSRAVNELFYYLYNSFKKAMSEDKLDDEVRTLRRGMGTTGILTFVLGKMLPSILRATFENHDAHPLLDAYGEALRLLLTGSVVAQEVPKDDLVLVTDLYRVFISILRDFGGPGRDKLGCDQAYVLRRAVSILNSFWPTLQVVPYMMTPPDSTLDLWGVMGYFSEFSQAAASYFGACLSEKRQDMSISEMRRGLDPFALSQDPAPDRQAAAFTTNITNDVARNWIRTRDTINVRMPGGGGGGGVKQVVQSLDETVTGFYEQLAIWNRWWETMKTSDGGAGVGGYGGSGWECGFKDDVFMVF